MQQLRLAGFRIAPTCLQAARLEVDEVGAGGDLAILALPRQPHLQVVGLGGREAEVAGAQGDHAVRQSQFLQNGLGVSGQLLQGVEGVVRTHRLDQFHLVELVLTDHTAGVLAVCAGLGPEAGGVRHPLAGHVVRLHDDVPHQVGHRHLGGGDQAEVGALQAEQILLEFRQLAGAEQAVAVDQIGYVGLGIAVLAGVGVEHELGQRPVQARQGAGHDHEARAGQLGRRVEVQAAQGLAQVDMILGLEIELRYLAPGALLAVVLLVLPVRDRVMRNVGHAERDIAQRGLHLVQRFFGHLELVSQAGHLVQQGLDVLPRGLGLADGLGARVALVLQFLGLHLQRLALLLQLADAIGVELQAASGELSCHLVEFGAQAFGVQHEVYSRLVQVGFGRPGNEMAGGNDILQVVQNGLHTLGTIEKFDNDGQIQRDVQQMHFVHATRAAEARYTAKRGHAGHLLLVVQVLQEVPIMASRFAAIDPDYRDICLIHAEYLLNRSDAPG